MHNPESADQHDTASVMKFAVPIGSDTLLVGSRTGENLGETDEDRLRIAGKELLGKTLSPNYGWGENGVVNYVSDPLDDSGHAQSDLMRLLYEQRWMPDSGETDFIIYDLNKPAVEVRPLTSHSSSED